MLNSLDFTFQFSRHVIINRARKPEHDTVSMGPVSSHGPMRHGPIIFPLFSGCTQGRLTAAVVWLLRSSLALSCQVPAQSLSSSSSKPAYAFAFASASTRFVCVVRKVQ